MLFKRVILQGSLGLAFILPGSAMPAQFELVVIPDTQMLVEKHPQIFLDQMDWIVNNRDSRHIAYVAHLGDMKDDGACDNQPVTNPQTGLPSNEWDIVEFGYTKLDNINLPYGVLPGNHDFDPIVNGSTTECPRVLNSTQPGIDTGGVQAGWNTTEFDTRFGPLTTRINQPWYGDPLAAGGPVAGNRLAGTNRDNFTLFESNGIKFIAINLGYRELAYMIPGGQTTEQALETTEIGWADDLLKDYPDRLGIVTSHYFMDNNPDSPVATETPTNLGSFSQLGPYGAQVYAQLSDNQNLLMMLSAHRWGEAWFSGVRSGMQPAQVIMSDYQRSFFPSDPVVAAARTPTSFSRLSQASGGGFGDAGFLRILTFDTETCNVHLNALSPATSRDRGTGTFIDHPEFISNYYPQKTGNNIANPGLGMRHGSVSSLLEFSFAGYVTDDFGLPCPSGTIDTVDSFDLGDAAGVDTTGSTWVESASIGVAGVNVAVPISIDTTDGGEYRIDTLPWTSAAGSVFNSQRVQVRLPRPGESPTTVAATLTIGDQGDTFTVTTGVPTDTTPDTFSFIPGVDVTLGASATSNAITVAGINAPTNIAITGGSYAIGGDTPTTEAGTVSAGQTVEVILAASANFSTMTTATLTIGGVTADFSVTTIAADTTPDSFAFNQPPSVAPGTIVTSNSITVGGINAPADIAITGGSYAIGGDTPTTEAGTVSAGQTVEVILAASANFSTETTATLTIGGVSAEFSVTTIAADTTPDSFAFSQPPSVAPGTIVTSNSITVGGINAPADIAITGGSYAIGGDTPTTEAGTASAGQTVEVILAASANFSTVTTATLTIGGVSADFSVTTIAADTTPTAFTFNLPPAVAPGTTITSDPITVGGINSPASISITGGEYSIANNIFTSASGAVSDGQQVRVQVTASDSPATPVTATLTIGGVSGSFTATTRNAEILLTFQSTVSHVFNQGGGLPTGIAEDDSVIFSVTIPTDAVSAGPSSAFSSGCDFGDRIDCENASWTFPAAPYTLTYSSGYVQTGQITEFVIENGGIEAFDDFSFVANDYVGFADGNNTIYQVYDHDGLAFRTAIPADLASAISDIDQAGVFERAHYWGNWGNWGTYHYDYIKPQNKTVVTSSNPSTVTTPADGIQLTFQSTVSAVFNQGGGLPPGITIEDSVTFATTIPADATPIGPSFTFFSECNFGDRIDCESVAWTFSAVPYTLTYSSGYVQTGQITELAIENGGTEVFDNFSFPASDFIAFADGSNSIYQVYDHDGEAFTSPIAVDMATAVNTVDQAGLFERTHYWGNWGDWGTYHYDYTRPQNKTNVTRTQVVP